MGRSGKIKFLHFCFFKHTQGQGVNGDDIQLIFHICAPFPLKSIYQCIEGFHTLHCSMFVECEYVWCDKHDKHDADEDDSGDDDNHGDDDNYGVMRQWSWALTGSHCVCPQTRPKAGAEYVI